MTGLRLTHPATPFATELRSRPGESIRLGKENEPTVELRVEVPEVWDTVRIDATQRTSIGEIKRAALDALYPAPMPDAFVIKRSGWLVRDEHQTVEGIGAHDGTIFLVTYRQRRPVRI